MTKREMFDVIEKMVMGEEVTIKEVINENEPTVERKVTVEEVVAFCEHEKELLTRKRSRSDKPTKTQLENEKIKVIIKEVLENAGVGMIISEMQKTEELGAYSNQKLSALCNKMVKDEEIQKKIIKKKPYFAVNGIEITEKE
jgi:hypothetical protein